MTLLTTRQIIIRISAIIAAAEFLIMLLISVVPYKLNVIAGAALDVIMLSALATPLIYLWIIKPFAKARDEAHAQVSQLAFTDPLTRLANRRQLLIHLQKTISGCNRHKTYGALLLIDLDGFKLVNDLHGHEAGDAVLSTFANRISTSIRDQDFASRLDGDEFVVLIDRIDTNLPKAREKILKIADKIIQLANTPIEFNGNTLQVGASIGITVLGFEPLDADAALRRSDVAMCRAKKAGKGRAGFSD